MNLILNNREKQMEEDKYEQLKKDVTRLNEEGFVPEGKHLHVYKNADELIEAIRNNQVPGIKWTEEDEAKWQASEAIENAFKESEIEKDTELGNWKSGTVEEFFKDITWSEEELEALGEGWFINEEE